MEEFNFIIDDTNNLVRVDKFLSEQLTTITRSFFAKLIEQENVKVNGKKTSKNYKLKVGDIVNLVIPEPTTPNIEAQNIPIEIVYEDKHLLVVNKPKGMVVHPAVGNYDETLVNALMYHCGDSLSGINGVLRPGIVHRIDKNTSGLLIVAKSDIAHKGLAEQIKEHSFKREYQAVVYGNFKTDTGTINAPIGRNPKDRKKMCVIKSNSKEAVSHYEVIERYGNFSHIKVKLETGRTHQIRVHMAYSGRPVAGDDVYGPKNVIKELKGQCLHAGLIGFIHPITNEYLEFEAPLPKYFKKFINKLEKGQV